MRFAKLKTQKAFNIVMAMAMVGLSAMVLQNKFSIDTAESDLYWTESEITDRLDAMSGIVVKNSRRLVVVGLGSGVDISDLDELSQEIKNVEYQVYDLDRKIADFESRMSYIEVNP